MRNGPTRRRRRELHGDAGNTEALTRKCLQRAVAPYKICEVLAGPSKNPPLVCMLGRLAPLVGLGKKRTVRSDRGVRLALHRQLMHVARAKGVATVSTAEAAAWLLCDCDASRWKLQVPFDSQLASQY